MKRFLTIFVFLLMTIVSMGATKTVTLALNGSWESNTNGFFNHKSLSYHDILNYDSKFSGATYDGIYFTSGLCLWYREYSRDIYPEIFFFTPTSSRLTIVQSSWKPSYRNSVSPIMLDDNELSVDSAETGDGCLIYTKTNLPIGNHTIKGTGDSGLLYVKLEFDNLDEAKQAYAVLKHDVNSTYDDYMLESYGTFYSLSFYYDDRILDSSHHSYSIPIPYSEGDYERCYPEIYLINDSDEYPSWFNYNYKDGIVKVIFDPSFAEYQPTSTSHWFEGFSLLSIQGISNFNTSRVTDMSYMFAGCDFSYHYHGETLPQAPQINNYNRIFYCDIISELNMSSVQDIRHMLDGVNYLRIDKLDIPQDVNSEGCFSNLKILELTSADVHIPENYFSSVNGCQVFAPTDFYFGIDTSSGSFNWAGGNFSIPKKQPYVRKGYNDYLQDYMYNIAITGGFDFFYDDLKELRNIKENNAYLSGHYNYDGPYNITHYKYLTIDDYLESRYLFDWDFSRGEGWVPTIYVNIDTSFADYYPTESTDEWFNFYISEGWESDDNSDYYSHFEPIPSENIHITGLEYLNSPVQSTYALLTPDKTTLTFYCDYQRHVREEPIYDLNDNSTSPTWLSEKDNITKVVFDPSFADARPITTRYWFNNMSNLSTIEGLDYLNTSEVTSMYSMFSGCSKLDSLDLSTFDTSQTTSMTGMFNNCTYLKYLNLSGFDLSSATSIRLMFQNCTSLESVDLGMFDTSNVTDLRNLFYGCTSLTGLDLSTMVIADDAQTGNLLYNCTALQSLKVSPTFGKINSKACTGVGTTSAPCRVYAPDGFDFGTDTSGESFKWKGGYFKLGIDPTISIANVSAYTGVNVETAVSLTIGYDDYTGYQFDIMLPEGISLVKTKSGYKYTLSSRFSGDGVSCAINKRDDGSYRVICYSTNHTTISGTEGVLITFPVVADDAVAPGTYTCHVRNFTLNDIGNNSVYAPDAAFSFTVLAAPTGDVNHDGAVDISDVLATVDYILGKNPVNYSKSEGDINNDGEINISDVLCIVDIILGKYIYQVPANAREATLDNLFLLRKDNTYTLCLENHEPYAGFQMHLSLPDGCTLRNARLVTERSDGHQLSVRDHGDGTYTLLAYSSNGNPLRDNGTPLLRLTLNGTHNSEDIQISDILFSTPQLETVILSDVSGTATGIMDIATDSNDTTTAYNTQGQRVSPNYRGIIIKNGEKRVMK